MSFSPSQGARRTSYFVHPFSPEGSHELKIGAITSPSSGSNSNIISYSPIVVPSICRVYRFFWTNASTVGTDFVQAGIYEDAASGPGRILGASPPVLSAGADACQFTDATTATGHIVTQSSSTTDGTSFTTASVTLRKGRLYTLFFTNSKASAADAAASIDNGPTFASRQSLSWDASTAHRSSLWTAVPATDYTGTLVINFGGGNTQTGCIWTLLEWLNVDTTTNDGIVQTATGTGNSATPLATLSAVGAANNPVLGYQGNPTGGQTPGTGFTEFTDTSYSTPTTAHALEWGYNDTTVDATITSAQWGMIATEIKSKYGPNDGFVLNPGRYWLAWMANGATATILRSSSSAITNRELAGYRENVTTNWLPANATPASPATVARTIPLSGFTTIASP